MTTRQRTKQMPRYVGMVAAGGESRRFGDVKPLGFIAGKPLLEQIINAIRLQPSDIVYICLNLNAAFEVQQATHKGEMPKKISPELLYTQEILDYIRNLDTNCRYIFAESKAEGIHSLSKFESHPDTKIAAVNGDAIALSCLVTYEWEQPSFRRAISEGLNTLEEKQGAAYIALFPLAQPKERGRCYELTRNGRITSISDKNVSSVGEQAAVFIFDSTAVAKLIVPARTTTEPTSPSWLCHKLIKMGKGVFGKRYNEKLYDLNFSDDYSMLRQDLMRKKIVKRRTETVKEREIISQILED